MANHVFISYSREDQTYTRKLVDSLHRQGFDVWIDDRIDFGERWWQSIVQAIRASAAFVVVMTPESEKSPWVERELLLALKEGKKIFPLLLRGEEFPILINAQYANVRSGQMPPEDFYDRLRQELVVVEVPESPPAQPKVRREGKVAPFGPAGDRWRNPKDGKEMVRVRAGKFLYGDDKREVGLPKFWIDKAPVTNAEYARFVAETGRQWPQHWNGKTPPKQIADHPVTYVSWHDAAAYAEWASGRLPTEEEWEKAARGTDGRKYPWGEWAEGRCNSKEAGIGDTTPVGKYSTQGDSPYGCQDCAGNVWEWTASEWELGSDFRVLQWEPGSDFRVLRGGAFFNEVGRVRCAARNGFFPYYRVRHVGFRLVADRAPG